MLKPRRHGQWSAKICDRITIKLNFDSHTVFKFRDPTATLSSRKGKLKESWGVEARGLDVWHLPRLIIHFRDS